MFWITPAPYRDSLPDEIKIFNTVTSYKSSKAPGRNFRNFNNYGDFSKMSANEGFFVIVIL